MTLILAALCLQDPSLDDLLKRLNEEGIAEREKVAAQITALGEPALPALRKALAAASGEEKARIQACMAAIERDVLRRNFQGGKRVGAFAARLSVPKRIHGPDEEVTLTLEVMNVSEEAAGIVPPTELNALLPENGGTSTSAHGSIEIKLLYGPKPQGGGREIACGAGPQREIKMLQPGESVTAVERFNLDKGWPLAAGFYEATAKYYSLTRKLLAGATEDIVTNTVTFWVGPYGELIDSLVAELGSDDIAARDPAEERLFDLRSVAEERIKAAREKATGEAKARLANLVERIDRRRRLEGMTGGAPVAGFQAFLKVRTAKVKAGDAIELDLEIANITGGTTDLVKIEYWEWSLPEYSTSLSAAAGRIVVKRISGKRTSDTFGHGAAGTKSPPPMATVKLKPDETYVRSAKVSTAGDHPLGPGEYEIRIVYYAKTRGLVGDAGRDLETNGVRVVVE